MLRIFLTLKLFCANNKSVRLACFKHAASVRPELGSNSNVILYFFRDLFVTSYTSFNPYSITYIIDANLTILLNYDYLFIKLSWVKLTLSVSACLYYHNILTKSSNFYKKF